MGILALTPFLPELQLVGSLQATLYGVWKYILAWLKYREEETPVAQHLADLRAKALSDSQGKTAELCSDEPREKHADAEVFRKKQGLIVWREILMAGVGGQDFNPASTRLPMYLVQDSSRII